MTRPFTRVCNESSLLHLLLAVGFLFLLPVAGVTGATAPTINLFPTTVLEEIKHTGDVAKEMETGLQPVIQRLDQQQQLYLESKCEGGGDDPGCEHIARQLGATYLEMLDIMANRLPEMEDAVNGTSNSLEKRLRNELGRKNTAWSLQELILGGSVARTEDQQPALRGRSGMRLSTRFSQYYKLVARPGSRSKASLAVVASDIYLDMQETAQLIARTRDEINRATLMGQLNQSLGTITPEMQEVVAGVKSILFGEDDGGLPVAEAAPGRSTDEFESPLKL
ncbi:MAG: hypothetical protein GY703_15715 [Gammaproteobacteria bacterium]|nr:hypothetical protein [Gammaproteobacteria bacterium]